MDNLYNSKDDGWNTTMLLVYGLASVVVARFLELPTWVLITIFGLVLLQTILSYFNYRKVNLLLELVLSAGTLVMVMRTHYFLPFSVFWMSYGVFRWEKRSKVIVMTMFTLSFIMAVIGYRTVDLFLEQSIILVLLSMVILRFGVLLQMHRQQNNHLNDRIAEMKEEALSLQAVNDEKFKEVLSAKVSMEERYAELYTLQIINDVANSELSIDILGEKVVDILTGLTGSTACSVILINPDQTPSILASNIASKEQKEALLTPEAIAMYHQVINGEGLATKAQEMELLKHRGTRSYVVVPLRLKTGGLGIIFAEHNVEHAFNTETRKILMTAADRLAIAIDNARLYDRMERMAVTDALTGVYNRLYLHQYLFKLFQENRPDRLALIIFDADHFKKVNDTYGHLTGDTTLKQLASIAKRLLPAKGLVARYGGEEFVLIVPEYSAEQMKILAEVIREEVAKAPIRAENGIEFFITISLGVSEVPSYASSAESLLESADQALYRAKQSGRNRVCVAD